MRSPGLRIERLERAGWKKKKKKKYRLIELKEIGRGEAAWRVVIFDRSIEIDTAYSVQMQLSRRVSSSWKISRRNGWLFDRNCSTRSSGSRFIDVRVISIFVSSLIQILPLLVHKNFTNFCQSIMYRSRKIDGCVYDFPSYFHARKHVATRELPQGGIEGKTTMETFPCWSFH